MRVERRTLRTTPILTLGQKWKGLKQGFEITRERTSGGQKTVGVVYGISRLSAGRADAATLLQHVRDRWLIENQLHHVRDVTLREDACRLRSANAPHVLAALRNAMIRLPAGVEADSRPSAIEQLQINPEQAKEIIGVSQYEYRNGPMEGQ